MLSFGHVHRVESFRSGVLAQAAAAIHAQTAVEPAAPASKQTGLAFDYCAICVAVKMGAAAVPPEAPASNVPAVAGKVRFAPHAEAAARTLAHLLSQARAPPSA